MELNVQEHEHTLLNCPAHFPSINCQEEIGIFMSIMNPKFVKPEKEM